MVEVKFLPHGNLSRNEIESNTGSVLERNRKVLLSGCERNARGDCFAVALTLIQAKNLAECLLKAIEKGSKANEKKTL